MNDPPKNWNPRVWRSRDIPKRSLCVNRLLPILLLLSCGGPQRTDYDPGPEGIATTHLLSNTEFPHRVAEFRWQGNTLYDSEGMSASSEYRNRDGVLITVYVYPRPRVHPEPDADLRDELQQSIYAMESVHTDFNLLLQDPTDWSWVLVSWRATLHGQLAHRALKGLHFRSRPNCTFS